MPEGVGYGVEDHDKLVGELVEFFDHYRDQLANRHKEMVSDHQLYLGKRDDRRQAHEKWRSWSWLGDPFQQTETEVQSWLEIMNSMDPPYQTEGVGTEDEWKARGFERALSYFLTGNKWTGVQEKLLRSLSIQGWKVLKTGWKEEIYHPIQRAPKEQLIEFDTAVNDALKTGRVTSPPDPFSNPDEFAGWMQSTQALIPSFPDAPPAPSETKTIKYRGPWLYRPSEFDLFFDPFVEDWSEHQVFIQRVVKPHSWVERQVEEGKFDREQVAKAGTGAEEGRLSKWDQQIASQIGQPFNDNDPIYKSSDELLEVWRVHDDKAPYVVILNRKSIVNVSTQHPYWHRQLPYVCVKNVPMERRAYGLGSYHQLRRIFQDRLTFRDLLFDGLVLSVLPVFLKSRNLGMSELQRFLQPGAILEVNDPNGLKRGWESMAGFAELMKVGEMLLQDQNMLLSTGENVRGQTSTVGRVSATESQMRLTQALVRHKKKAERLEEEQSEFIPQWFSLVYQKWPTENVNFTQLRADIVGEDTQDPLLDQRFTRETFSEQLAANIKFRGATSKLNKELWIQQLKDFLATVSQVQSASGIPTQIMTPVEARAIIRRMYDAFGQKGSAEIFTKEGDEAAMKMLEAHMIQAQNAPIAAQARGAQWQAQLAQLTAPQPAPGNGVPPEEQAQEQPAEQPIA